MASASLIITADDFGLSKEVNEAVEEAHRKGVLTCASLMVTGAAAADAVERARRMPGLGVGLHLALVDAPSALDRQAIPDLCDDTGLGSTPASTGFRIAVLRSVRDQARAEMRAQFELFARTGLKLDHVDGHWHFHQHPTLIGLMIREMAPAFGVRAVRVPNEPAFASWRAAGREGLIPRCRTALAQGPLWSAMRCRLRGAGIGCNDWFFGLRGGGHVNRERLLGMIANLPPGVSEIGMHPASGPIAGPHAPPSSWTQSGELAALIDPDVVAACSRIRLGSFEDLVGYGASA